MSAPRSKQAVNLRSVLVTELTQAQILRQLRNDCRSYLTNYREEISETQQADWFHNQYVAASQQGVFRAYLFLDVADVAVGYGALVLQDEQLYITECVAVGQRGKGFGTAILQALIAIASDEKRPLVAEIWATNAASIALHKRAGFQQLGSRPHAGAELLIYQLMHA